MSVDGSVVMPISCVKCPSREAKLHMRLPAAVNDGVAALDTSQPARIVITCANPDCDRIVDYGQLPVEQPPTPDTLFAKGMTR